MRIEIRTSGGFAGNISRPPLVLDTDELEPEAAREVETLAAGLPGSDALSAPPGRGADLMRYDVLIEDADGRRHASYDEPAVPAEARALLRRVREARRS